MFVWNQKYLCESNNGSIEKHGNNVMGYVYVTIPIYKGPYLPHEGGYGGYFYSDKVNLQYDAVGTVGHIKLLQKGGFKLQSGNIPRLMTNTYEVNGSNVNDPEQCWENGYQLPDILSSWEEHV